MSLIGKHFLLQTENDNLLSLNNTCLPRPSPYLHPVELLDRIGIALGVLQLEGVPLGLLHKGGGRPDEQHEHYSAHCDLLQVEKGQTFNTAIIVISKPLLSY